MTWARGDLVELDGLLGLLGVIVGLEGEPGVPEDHVAIWFGDPRTTRISEGGAGGVTPEIWTVPAQLCLRAAAPSYRH